MNNLIVFSNPQLGEIKTKVINGEPYFCGNDVANILGYSNPRDALINQCSAVIKCTVHTTGGMQKLNFIPEDDIYRLIIQSNLEYATKLKNWVISEIFPQIRKNSTY